MAKKTNGRNGKRARTTAGATSGASQATISGPARRDDAAHAPRDPMADKLVATDELAARLPANAIKAREYGADALDPVAGQCEAAEPTVTASTLTETEASEKAGSGRPPSGENPTNGPLDRVRVDSGGQALTTNQGTPLADNQSSLKLGLRGPALLEDFILREKITHFDHERIPERVVHARGSGAHGYFECYVPLTEYTRAGLFAASGKRTPVFVRFSTVVGERGSTDTARDVRGFAVKFYTDEGNFDLVGNNIPVFFIQDAMKFPDLVHAAKPEPHFAMPQAATAHDTFWDFVSLMPESTHMLLWVMSDRAIPRSYRMMQGFGVHTYRLVNEKGETHLVKFHWTPIAGTHSLDWDEAVKISGADPDFHRRDLWEAIEAGAFPEYELGMQIFTEEQAAQWSFDVLDATKIVPEELVPVTPVGRMVLNRNPDNFFAETEQVAFCVAHLVPGIDFTDDPLLAGRIHSYVDTQLTRLGGPNFHEIPINAPVAAVHNNQRDGLHRQAINRGRVNYEPNSLGGGCPFQAGARGFTPTSDPVQLRGEVGDDRKVRGKSALFAEHYAQATLFWNSQSPVEQAHIIRAFRFELTRVQTPAVRERVLATLANVAAPLAEAVAAGLGVPCPPPLPKAMPSPPRPEVEVSPPLSLLARPGDGTIQTRRVALLVADGVDAAAAQKVYATLNAAGAVPRLVGPTLGAARGTDGEMLQVDVSMEAQPAVLFDALVLLGGDAAVAALAEVGLAQEFIKDTYRHCKPILSIGADALLDAVLPPTLPSGEPDPGIVRANKASDRVLSEFAAAIARHRAFERYSDPPRV